PGPRGAPLGGRGPAGPAVTRASVPDAIACGVRGAGVYAVRADGAARVRGHCGGDGERPAPPNAARRLRSRPETSSRVGQQACPSLGTAGAVPRPAKAGAAEPERVVCETVHALSPGRGRANAGPTRLS